VGGETNIALGRHAVTNQLLTGVKKIPIPDSMATSGQLVRLHDATSGAFTPLTTTLFDNLKQGCPK
jgi:hypothetical protein